MDNQAQNRHPEDLEQDKHGQDSSKPARLQSRKASQTGTNHDQLAGTPRANKRNTKKNSSDQDPNALEGNSRWPDESLSPDGLVDREIGDGSEDLDDIETDGDDELSTK
jgi:hypothetical protein